MPRTRFALICYLYRTSAWWPIRLHATPCQLYDETVQDLLVFKRLFISDSGIEIYSSMLITALNPASSSAIISSAWGLSLEHDFAGITDETEASVLLAEL